MPEIFREEYLPIEAPFDQEAGRGKEKTAEDKVDVISQAHEYFDDLQTGIQFDRRAIELSFIDDNLLNPIVEVVDRARRVAIDAIKRNNDMADIVKDESFTTITNKQKKMRGPCAVGKIICIDGRLPTIHSSGVNEGHAAMTLEDAYGATLGLNDPERQVFTANTATIPEAVDHIVTQSTLMDKTKPRPHLLVISSGIAEDTIDNDEVRKGLFLCPLFSQANQIALLKFLTPSFKFLPVLPNAAIMMLCRGY